VNPRDLQRNSLAQDKEEEISGEGSEFAANCPVDRTSAASADEKDQDDHKPENRKFVCSDPTPLNGHSDGADQFNGDRCRNRPSNGTIVSKL